MKILKKKLNFDLPSALGISMETFTHLLPHYPLLHLPHQDWILKVNENNNEHLAHVSAKICKCKIFKVGIVTTLYTDGLDGHLCCMLYMWMQCQCNATYVTCYNLHGRTTCILSLIILVDMQIYLLFKDTCFGCVENLKMYIWDNWLRAGTRKINIWIFFNNGNINA